MRRTGLLLVALLALGCGSSEGGAAFDELKAGGGGNVSAGGVGGHTAGRAGAAAGGHAQAGEAPTTGASGGSAGAGGVTAGVGGELGGSAPQGGSGGTTVAGAGGAAEGGMSGGGTGGANGEAGATAGGGSGPVVCDHDKLDCTDDPGCETWKGEHDTCGSCEKKCGLSQVCKMFGSPGAWSFGCASP